MGNGNTQSKFHDKNWEFRTCVSSGSYYLYIVKYNPLYNNWCTENKKSLFNGYRQFIDDDIGLISHKRIKNVDHYNNCIKFTDVYDDVNDEDEDTIINETLVQEEDLDVINIPSNQLCDPHLKSIHDNITVVSIEGDTIETESRSGVTDEYNNDLQLIS